MARNRIDRISEEVHRALSETVRTLKDPRLKSGLVSITHCDVTGDLRYCKVYVSVLGSEEDKQNALRGLRSAAGFLRREVSQKIDIRYMPELIITPDDSISTGARITGILNQLNIEESGEDE